MLKQTNNDVLYSFTGENEYVEPFSYLVIFDLISIFTFDFYNKTLYCI